MPALGGHFASVGALTALVVACMGACAAAPRRVQSPAVEVAAVNGSALPAGLVLEVALVVRNQNERPLSLQAVDWEVRAGGLTRVRGRTAVAARIPAGAVARVDVDCRIAPGAAALLLPLLAGGIELGGVLHLDAASGRLEWSGPVTVR